MDESLFDIDQTGRSVSVGYKWCTKCGKRRLVTEIRKSWCKRCYSDYRREWVKSDRGAAYFRTRNSRPLERYRRVARNARKHGRSFTISMEFFLDLIVKSCHYCGGKLPATGGGMDRINNNKGYEPDNILPCCSECNQARSDYFTVEEMVTIIGPAIRRVREERAKKGSLMSAQT